MPISYKYKFKFIHIPKTGGSSIEVVFDLQHKDNLFVPSFTDEIQGVKFAPQHFTHSLINHFKPECKDYFSFTIVRNPYSKLISEYFYINKNFGNNPINNFSEDHFNKWFDTSLTKFDIDHKLPQTTFLDIPVDMVLKLENIEEDWKELNKKLGTDYKLVHDNKSSINKDNIVGSLNRDTKQKIYNIFKNDFEKLNYETHI